VIIKGFVFALVTLGMALMAAAPPIGALILVSQRRPSALVVSLVLVGILVYIAAAATLITVATYQSGLMSWVGS
jgi:hypothetical protein